MTNILQCLFPNSRLVVLGKVISLANKACSQWSDLLLEMKVQVLQLQSQLNKRF